MDLYPRMRQAVLVKGHSQRAVARDFRLARKTIRKMLESTVSPPYQLRKPVLRPNLGPRHGATDDTFLWTRSK